MFLSVLFLNKGFYLNDGHLGILLVFSLKQRNLEFVFYVPFKSIFYNRYKIINKHHDSDIICFFLL